MPLSTLLDYRLKLDTILSTIFTTGVAVVSADASCEGPWKGDPSRYDVRATGVPDVMAVCRGLEDNMWPHYRMSYDRRCGYLNEAEKNTLYWSIHENESPGVLMDEVWWFATKNKFGSIACKHEAKKRPQQV